MNEAVPNKVDVATGSFEQQHKLVIYSVFHRPYPVPPAKFIRPIQVNKNLADIDLGFAGDNSGDHISEKNSTYAELTALYWIWKNMGMIDSNYIGLCHYRRYFALPSKWHVKFRYRLLNKIKGKLLTHPSLSFIRERLIASDTLMHQLIYALEHYPLIVPKHNTLVKKDGSYLSVKDSYMAWHSKEDWKILEQIFDERFPEYKPSFLFCAKSNVFYPYNMLIAGKPFFDAYCTWLFAILFVFEARSSTPREGYQSRVFGFIGERLLMVYLHHHQIRAAEFPVCFY